MVNPLAPNSAASLPVNPVSLDTERPPLPEPARQVTPSAQTYGAGNSGTPHDTAQHAGEARAVEQTLEDVNDSLKAWSTGMRFEIDQDTQQVVVSLIDNETGEVLRTVPSEAVVKIAKMIVQLQGQTVRTSA